MLFRSIWELNVEANVVTYTQPNGSTINGTFINIANQEQDAMITGWLAYIKTIIDRILHGVAPAPTPWPAVR